MTRDTEGLRTTALLLWIDIVVMFGKLWQFLLRIMWTLNGVGHQQKLIQTGKEKKLTVQVLRNLYTLPYTVQAAPYCFLTCHDSFITPDEVLKPNVHLLSIERDVAKFVEVDPTLDILNLRKYPIFYMAQTAGVQRILVVQRRDFQKMLNDLEDDKREVVWMFHTIRCGSTVWSQIFNSLPNWSVLSEPQTMFYNVMGGRTETNMELLFESAEYEEWVVAIIIMHLRLIPKNNHVFWKEHVSMTDQMIPIIQKRYPNHKILFAYRDVLPNAMSFYKAFGKLPRFLNYVKHIYDDISDATLGGDSRFGRLFYTNGYNPILCAKAITASDIQPNALEWMVLLWATKIRMFREFKKDGIPIKCIRYDDICNDARNTIKDVFEYLNIQSELVEVGLKSMGLDSQEGLFFSRKNRASHDDWIMTDQCLARCNIVLRELGVGDMSSVTVL